MKPQKEVKPAARAREDEPPVIGPWFTLKRVGKGWVALSCKTQGRAVIEEEVINPDQKPVPRAHAEGFLKVAIVRQLLARREGEL